MADQNHSVEDLMPDDVAKGVSEGKYLLVDVREPNEVAAEAYPDAAYYKFGVYADSASGAETNYDYINKRVDGVEFTLDKPLKPGAYSVKVDAFNANDVKLAQSSNDMKFTVNAK